MPDIFTKAKRSEVMSRIRGRGNKETELARIRFFCRERITGWRRHVEVRIADCGLRNGAKPRTSHQSGKGVFSALRVRPDFVFPKFKVAVFVDGCFWHGCPLHATKPVTNRAFWRKKLAGNKTRDRLVSRTLRQAGWRVLRIWEHELVRKQERRLVARIQRFLL